jgi:hypothetical protein
VIIGAKESDLERITNLIFPKMAGVFLQSMLPRFMGRKFEPNFIDMIGIMRMFSSAEKPTSEQLEFTFEKLSTLPIPLSDKTYLEFVWVAGGQKTRGKDIKKAFLPLAEFKVKSLLAHPASLPSPDFIEIGYKTASYDILDDQIHQRQSYFWEV